MRSFLICSQKIIASFNYKVHDKALPWTTTLKSLSWSPASLVATHWNRAVSETWARETTSRRPLAATRNPSPCLTGFPSLYHLQFAIWILLLIINDSAYMSACVYVCLQAHRRRRSYVITGAGAPVAWHSSSRGLLIITVLSVTSSPPSIKGGTRREKMICVILKLYFHIIKTEKKHISVNWRQLIPSWWFSNNFSIIPLFLLQIISVSEKISKNEDFKYKILWMGPLLALKCIELNSLVFVKRYASIAVTEKWQV